MPTFESQEALLIDERPLESYFTAPLVERVCKANRPCRLEELFELGLEGDRADLEEVSMMTLPLNDMGRSLGFVLLYRPVPCRLRPDELHKAGLITCGLSHAIAGCRTAQHCSQQ